MGQPGIIQRKAPLDQFGTFEVFVQPRSGKPFQHEGAVHAPNREMAFILAKETFTRRFTCTSLYVADTRDVYLSPLSDGDQDAYDLIPETEGADGPGEPFEIYHLLKRGKQHIHAGTVLAASPRQAMAKAKSKLRSQPVFSVWAIRTGDIRFTTKDEQDLWATLPEKKFRDAGDYKGGEKLKTFLDKTQS